MEKTNGSNKVVELKDVYTPDADGIVFEFEIKDKTEGGIVLPDAAKKKYNEEQSFAKKVVAIGPTVKNYKIEDWVLINPSARITQVPVIYKSETGLQHGQVREYDVLGKVDEHFAQLKTTKEIVIN